MIGKIMGGIAGTRAARHSSSVSGASGAFLGAASVALLRRMSIPALIAVSAGGYAFKKYRDRKDAEAARRKDFETPPAAAGG